MRVPSKIRSVALAVPAAACLFFITIPAPGAEFAEQPGGIRHVDLPDQVPGGLDRFAWQSIRGAYEAGRHAVVEQHDGTHCARNPGQQWRTDFDGRGFLIHPDHGEWTWGMQLRAGRGNCSAVVADGNRLTYRWDGGIEEWFVNDRRGLEQGWTVESGSSLSASGYLTLSFTLRGGLAPRISDDQRSVVFLTKRGTVALDYGGLKAWGADRRSLPVRFVPGEDDAALSVSVDTSEAIYPITIDPIAQRDYLRGSNTGGGDSFGESVSVFGDTVVVGASGEASSATGVNGSGSHDNWYDAGAAYVFVHDGEGNWTQQAYLKASNTGEGDRFGKSVAISAETVVVGAPEEDSSATGEEGDENDNSAANSGAAYVFIRTGTTWTQHAYLKASNTEGGDLFGTSVAVYGTSVVVGAPEEDSMATIVDGDEDDNSCFWAGAAYVFYRSGENWSQQAYLKASVWQDWHYFGTSVAMSGNTAVVGAPGINGTAYVFVRSGAVWSQQTALQPTNPGTNDLFGRSIAIDVDTVVVGAMHEASAATGVNGEGSDESAQRSGAAYVFERSGVNWTQQAYLKASNTETDDRFGWSVAISGDTAVVGAREENSGATGVNGNQGDNSADSSGAAYLFSRSGVTWTQQAYIKASDTEAFDALGHSVSVFGDNLIVGSPGRGGAYAFDLNYVPEDIMMAVTSCNRVGDSVVIGFTSDPGISDWKVMGSSDLTGFPDDKTGDCSMLETSPGVYEATVDVRGEPAAYFLRIEK